MTNPDDFIQNGYCVSFGADGSITNVQHLNPHQLATTETADKLIPWLATNIPEGNQWLYFDLYRSMSNSNTKYNCPCWMMQASNGAQFNAGELYWNIFEYPNPTQSVVDELHKLAGA